METMQAARIHQFGGTEAVVIDDLPQPTPTAEQVLVRVHAAGINPIDAAFYSGAIRAYGFDPQLPHTLGSEVSGVVEAVGANVRDFRSGDAVVAVLGFPGGGYAEYVAVTPDLLAHKPASVSHLHMAGVPIAGLAAWQALFEHGHLQRGQRVLVLAASGGVGTFAVQFARWAGAEVFGTTSTGNLDFVRSLGATPIDYTAGPFEEAVQDVDLVIDPLAGESQVRAWRTLKPDGALISVVAPPSDPEGKRHTGMVIVQQSAHKISQLVEIGQLLASGAMQVVIDEVLPFREVQQALAKSASGRARGKIILSFEKA